jgi:hypothetical protein
VIALAVLCAAASAAAAPTSLRDVAFVDVTGKGAVRSVPRGIDCPRTCRAVFPRGTHLRLLATPARGWRLAAFRSKWCNGGHRSCVFDLVSPHDCIGGACPTGAFGVRAVFIRKE